MIAKIYNQYITKYCNIYHIHGNMHGPIAYVDCLSCKPPGIMVYKYSFTLLLLFQQICKNIANTGFWLITFMWEFKY